MSGSKIVSYGGGVNSTAMLIGLVERNDKPDYIIFSDTGGEKPQTYKIVSRLSEWLVLNGFPKIDIVSAGSLENECLKKHTVPSVAFGWASCSDKYKKRPINKFIRNLRQAKETWDRGEKVIKLIGFHCEEKRRAKDFSDNRYTVEYPMIQWGWGQSDCVNKCREYGFDVVKSACFFCPNSKKQEILSLAKTNPNLIRRAIAMEDNATVLTSLKGLGRSWAWKDLINANSEQLDMFSDAYGNERGCFFCYDGESCEIKTEDAK